MKSKSLGNLHEKEEDFNLFHHSSGEFDIKNILPRTVSQISNNEESLMRSASGSILEHYRRPTFMVQTTQTMKGKKKAGV